MSRERTGVGPRYKGLFLDRDGTLIVSKPFLSDPAGVVLLPGVAEALKQALSKGYHLFLFTNQSGVGRGYYSVKAVRACNQKMESLFNLPAPVFLEVCIATETPDQNQCYRKPAPCFVLEMIEKYHLDPRQCYMVGDRHTDIQTALNAGIFGVGVKTGDESMRQNTHHWDLERVTIVDHLPAFVAEHLH